MINHHRSTLASPVVGALVVASSVAVPLLGHPASHAGSWRGNTLMRAQESAG